ncbi:U-box domain-containing protein kinase family protein [Rhynchospora pubera]|uniref:RING-type E3 ubiquitin transferase n=1 Tax=Rhynchospora pubera TaxID=906938 RepID=A0AAV8E6F6_9POAL|nr:U-box domain-containing protein kinase family protein [Rhynchospora pubera]
MEIQELSETMGEAVPATVVTVGVAIKDSRTSKHVVKWALDKFTPEGTILFKLLYVLPKIKMVPTPMGNYIPISQVREDVASAYRKEMEWQAQSLLLPYKKMCSQYKVEAEAVLLESDDVPGAINEEIVKYKISRLVLGASSRNIFTRKISATQLSSRISACLPSFCTVYVISKGKLLLVKSATTEVHGKTVSSAPQECIVSAVPSILTSCSSGIRSALSDADELCKSLHSDPSIHAQRDHAHANINSNISDSRYTHSGRLLSSHTSINSDNHHSWYSDELSSSVSDCRTDLSHSISQDVSLELERLRVKLRQLRHSQESEASQYQSAHASQQMQELEIRVPESNATNLAMKEKEDTEKVELEELCIKICAEREAVQRQEDENSVHKEHKTLRSMLRGSDYEGDDFYRYTWQEIEDATSSFSDKLMIGRGSNGMVYKGKFGNMVAAVKVLHSLDGYGIKQLRQEIRILSKIQHPHLLLLLGACPEHGCLIYEYMQNGSLDDRLQCKLNSSPLLWHDRFRIASEVATTLAFLHSTKPNPIIHRDLKPANILLDGNLLSKIGDVGLSILLPNMNQTRSSGSRDTVPVGTFCYIDPEYQHTGTVSVKSDVYALGVVILQLLTGRSPVGLASQVESAVQGGYLIDFLDPKAGNWPMEEATQMALIGLSCAELRQKDRPDLSGTVVPALERLKKFAMRAKELASPPSHFICPIFQEVMKDPCVASDGYTYDRKSIELWLRLNDKSPMTNLKLPNKNLIPNHSLRSAILDWKSSRTRKTSPI